MTTLGGLTDLAWGTIKDEKSVLDSGIFIFLSCQIPPSMLASTTDLESYIDCLPPHCCPLGVLHSREVGHKSCHSELSNTRPCSITDDVLQACFLVATSTTGMIIAYRALISGRSTHCFGSHSPQSLPPSPPF